MTQPHTPDIDAAKFRLRKAAKLLEDDWKANGVAQVAHAYEALGGDPDDLFEGSDSES